MEVMDSGSYSCCFPRWAHRLIYLNNTFQQGIEDTEVGLGLYVPVSVNSLGPVQNKTR